MKKHNHQKPATSDNGRDSKTDDVAIAEKLAELDKIMARSGNSSLITPQQKKLVLGGFLVAAILFFGVIFLFSSDSQKDEIGEVVSKGNLIGPAALEDGDVFKEERETFYKARSGLASGECKDNSAVSSNIVTLLQLAKDSPKSPQAPEALLLAAVTLRYNVGDKEKAIHTYETFLQQYPKHKKAKKARKVLIELLDEERKSQKIAEHAKILLASASTEQDRNFAEYFLNKPK